MNRLIAILAVVLLLGVGTAALATTTAPTRAQLQQEISNTNGRIDQICYFLKANESSLPSDHGLFANACSNVSP